MTIVFILSLRTLFSEYEIKDCNEYNFDVNIIQYTKDAYAAKKYAFVIDYARSWILYHYGGVYFDADVEIVRPIDGIIEKGVFVGQEALSRDAEVQLTIAPGLVIGSEKDKPIYKLLMDEFVGLSFGDDNSRTNSYSMIPMVSSLFVDYGLRGGNEIEMVLGITIYPPALLYPYGSIKGDLVITGNTRSVY